MLKFLENKLVYHPTPAAVEWHDPPHPGVRDIILHTSGRVPIHAWWYPHETSTGALLYCHGNAGNVSQRIDSVVDLQQRMHESVLIFDYPGFGKSGGKPTEAGCYAAADAAYDWLTEVMKVPSNRLMIYGSSLGGGVAIDLASRRDHRALMVVNTFTSVPDVGRMMYPWAPIRWLMRNRFDNLAKIKRGRRPVFIASGTADDTVPFPMGEQLFAAANAPKFFHRMEGAGHDDPLAPAFFEAFARFLADSESQ